MEGRAAVGDAVGRGGTMVIGRGAGSARAESNHGSVRSDTNRQVVSGGQWAAVSGQRSVDPPAVGSEWSGPVDQWSVPPKGVSGGTRSMPGRGGRRGGGRGRAVGPRGEKEGRRGGRGRGGMEREEREGPGTWPLGGQSVTLSVDDVEKTVYIGSSSDD